MGETGFEWRFFCDFFSSQSVGVVPSATFPQRGVMPAVKSNDDTSCVFAGAAVADNANVCECPW